MNPTPSFPHKLIVALDVPTAQQAREIVDDLDGLVWFYKIGLELFLAVNESFLKELRDRQCRIFLDLKLNDIDETVRRAVHLASDLGIELLTVLGNHATVRAAMKGRKDESLKLLTVPLLSSWSEKDVQELGLVRMGPGDTARFPTLDEYVLWRADAAMEQGCDGLIASGKFVKIFRDRFGPGVLIVSPGVRPAGQDTNEHQRSLTPGAAIQDGADYLVVGRPVRDASNRREMAQHIHQEIESALKLHSTSAQEGVESKSS